jgi:hypothetical protein
VLNRIILKHELERIIGLLEEHDQEYVVDHFILSEYSKNDWEFNLFSSAVRLLACLQSEPRHSRFHGKLHPASRRVARGLALCSPHGAQTDLGKPSRNGHDSTIFDYWKTNPLKDRGTAESAFSVCSKQERIPATLQQYMREAKNNYVMNNNGLRNTMMDLGIELGATWVFPWDGNCFLTPPAWKRIQQAIETHGDSWRYMYTMMDRISDNKDLTNPNYQPNPVEEPQIIFRRDARERFNEHFMYGRRPKVDFIIKLGIPGKWDAWNWEAWEPDPHLQPVTDAQGPLLPDFRPGAWSPPITPLEPAAPAQSEGDLAAPGQPVSAEAPTAISAEEAEQNGDEAEADGTMDADLVADEVADEVDMADSYKAETKAEIISVGPVGPAFGPIFPQPQNPGLQANGGKPSRHMFLKHDFTKPRSLGVPPSSAEFTSQTEARMDEAADEGAGADLVDALKEEMAAVPEDGDNAPATPEEAEMVAAAGGADPDNAAGDETGARRVLDTVVDAMASAMSLDATVNAPRASNAFDQASAAHSRGNNTTVSVETTALPDPKGPSIFSGVADQKDNGATAQWTADASVAELADQQQSHTGPLTHEQLLIAETVDAASPYGEEPDVDVDTLEELGSPENDAHYEEDAGVSSAIAHMSAPRAADKKPYCIVSNGVGPFHAPMLEFTRAAKQKYADLHGYVLLAASDPSPETYFPKLAKLQALLDSFEEPYDCEWSMWLDADATIVDTAISFDDLLMAKPGASLVFGAHRKGDCEGSISSKISGSAFMVKNTDWGREYLLRALRARVGTDNVANVDKLCLGPAGFVSAACKMSTATRPEDMEHIMCHQGAGFCWDCDGSNSCARHAGGTWMFGMASPNLKLSSHSGDFLVYQNNACDNLALRCFGSGEHCGAAMSLDYMREVCLARLDMCSRGPEVCRDYKTTCELDAGKKDVVAWRDGLEDWKRKTATTIRPHSFGDTPEDSWERTIVPAAGWVARCSSGHKEEGSAADRLAARGSARNDAVVFLMQRLDVLGAEALRGYHIDLPTFYNAKVLKAERDSGTMLAKLRGDVKKNAAKALPHGPWSVTDKGLRAPSGDVHDYLSAATFHHPSEDGTQCEFRPEEPYVAMYSADSGQYDSSRFLSMVREPPSPPPPNTHPACLHEPRSRLRRP